MAINTETYYRRYGPMVLRRCRRLLGDEERAVDAMQDVFVKLLSNEHRLSDAAPSSLLWRMATNICLNKIRSDKRHPETRDDDLLARIATLDVDQERRTGAGKVLGRLFAKERESTRTIAVMHYLDGMTLEETASAVGMSVSGVRKRLRGLRAQLHAMEAV